MSRAMQIARNLVAIFVTNPHAARGQALMFATRHVSNRIGVVLAQRTAKWLPSHRRESKLTRMHARRLRTREAIIMNKCAYMRARDARD